MMRAHDPWSAMDHADIESVKRLHIRILVVWRKKDGTETVRIAHWRRPLGNRWFRKWDQTCYWAYESHGENVIINDGGPIKWQYLPDAD